MKFRFLLAFLFTAFAAATVMAQNSYNVNAKTISFLAANKVHKVGTNGQSIGDKTLYTNVVKVGTQNIDCIVTTVSLTGGSFTLPGSAPSGTIPFDYSSTSGTAMTSNEDSFFSPTFSWNSTGGSAKFRFEFIAGGTYNNSTKKGTAVILKNVYINTYDIDGNGGTNSNQFAAFGGFTTSQYQTTTGGYIQTTYNVSDGKTTFRSNTNNNSVNVVDDKTRIRVYYASISDFEIAVGAGGAGAAYYFLDFGFGPAWTSAPSIISAPKIEFFNGDTNYVNTTNVSNCNIVKELALNTSNVTTTSTIDSVYFSFNTADILDGASERLVIDSATAGDTIRLNFTNATTLANLVFKGVTYRVIPRVSGSISTLVFYRSGAKVTVAQSESLLNAFGYLSTDCSPTAGARAFTFSILQGSFMSNKLNMTANVLAPLPLTLLDFRAEFNGGAILVKWKTIQEEGSSHFNVLKSEDGASWNSIGSVAANNTPNVSVYAFRDEMPVAKNYYKLEQVDINGKISYSKVCFVANVEAENALSVYPNPSNGQVTINSAIFTNYQVYNIQTGALVSEGIIDQTAMVSELSKGLYFVVMSNDETKEVVKLIVQ
ncbi:MAG: T9SS type A sorting domain-containing protein [Chitinophagaceae bacterium]